MGKKSYSKKHFCGMVFDQINKKVFYNRMQGYEKKWEKMRGLIDLCK
jgi:hypothetical protein